MRIYLIVFLLATQQILVILDRQKCGRKQDCTASPEHAFLQIFPGIHTEQLQLKASVLTHSGIFHIVFVLSFINIQEMAELEVEVQQVLPHLQTDLLLLLQIIADDAVKSGQRLYQHVYIIHQPVAITIPLHGQQLGVALLQHLADPFRIAFPHKSTFSIGFLQLMPLDIQRICSIALLRDTNLWQLF